MITVESNQELGEVVVQRDPKDNRITIYNEELLNLQRDFVLETAKKLLGTNSAVTLRIGGSDFAKIENSGLNAVTDDEDNLPVDSTIQILIDILEPDDQARIGAGTIYRLFYGDDISPKPIIYEAGGNRQNYPHHLYERIQTLARTLSSPDLEVVVDEDVRVQALIEAMSEVEIPIVPPGFGFGEFVYAQFQNVSGLSPICAVTGESIPPTKEERNSLRAWAEIIQSKHVPPYFRKKQGLYFEGANTAIFTKRRDGKWQMRRSSWDLGSTEPMTLEELLQLI